MSTILLHALVFLTPFIFVQATNELFEFPKMYFVYFAGSLLFVITALGRLWGSGGRLNRTDGFTHLLGLFVASFVVSTLFSTHQYTSLWGYFSRFNGGFVSVLIFFSIYWATLQLKPSTTSLLKTVSFTALPISIYSIMQHFGLGGSWATDTTIRAFSTFGQPNWYGAYCAMVLPIVLYLGLTAGGENEKNSAVNSLGWFALFVLGFTGFWFSYSVSGIIGLMASLVALLILNFRTTKKIWLPLVVLAGLCLVIAFLNQGIFKQKLTDALTDIFTNPPTTTIQITNNANIENFQKPQNADDSNPRGSTDYQNAENSDASEQVSQTKSPNYNLTDSGFIRKGIWQGAVDLWLASPKNFFIGTGPETFPYQFQQFRPASLNYSSEWNFILNKPHNYYLELLAQNGVVGLLIYLTIVIKVLFAKHPVLTPALVGLFITNIFGWPTVSTTLLFWLFLGLLTLEKLGDERNEKSRGDYIENKSVGTKQNPSDVKTTISLTNPTDLETTIPLINLADDKTTTPPSNSFLFVTTALLPLLLVALYLYANVYFGRHVLADIFSKASAQYFDAGEIQKALDFSNKAVHLNPNEPFYYRQRAKTYMLTTVGQTEDQPAYIKTRAYQDVITAQNLNPQNLATLRGEIPLYYFLALKDISKTANSQNERLDSIGRGDINSKEGDRLDQFNLELARNYYLKLSQNYSNDVGVQTQVAKYQKMLGLQDDLDSTVSMIKNLRPDLLEWYLL